MNVKFAQILKARQHWLSEAHYSEIIIVFQPFDTTAVCLGTVDYFC